MTLRTFTTLGFAPSYSCEPDPELPGTGDWACPTYGFGRNGLADEPFRSRWGAPLIARFTLPDGGTWVGFFEAGGMGGTDGIFACPAPSMALAVCDGQAYYVDVAVPAQSTPVTVTPVTHIRRAGDDLMVLASFFDLTAISPHGQIWISERHCLDDLQVLAADTDNIECSGTFIEGTNRFTVDTRTGRIQTGPR